ncbi:MAG: PIN domain-containing protein [Pseudolysinimonas sp.]
MTVLVDTSVWSLALRRDPPDVPELHELRRVLAGGDLVATTGLIIQELLQGLVTATSREGIRERMSRMSQISVELDDHTAAAEAFVRCRERGIQLGTVDALIATLCTRRGHTLLTTDRDFTLAAPHLGLRVWRPG